MKKTFSLTPVWVLTFLLALIGFGANAQKAITGKTLTNAGKTPIVGGAVLLKGTTLGIQTDADGTFRITVPTGKTVFGYFGRRF